MITSSRWELPSEINAYYATWTRLGLFITRMSGYRNVAFSRQPARALRAQACSGTTEPVQRVRDTPRRVKHWQGPLHRPKIAEATARSGADVEPDGSRSRFDHR